MPPLTAANELIRARNVTASEVGALLGEHPYTSAGKVWDRLCGLGVVKAPTPAMEFGSATEQILARMAERYLQPFLLFPVRVRLNARTFEHPRVRLCATPDAYLLGTSSLLELKTSWSQHRWTHGLPPDIAWQARAQMACTHRNEVIVYVFSGSERSYVVTRHRGKERAMTQAVERFWSDHIATGTRPADPIKADIEFQSRKPRVAKHPPRFRIDKVEESK